MKIAVVSTDSHRLHEIAAVLSAYQLALIEGDRHRLRAAVDHATPDLIVFDSAGDAADLSEVEFFISSFPQVAIVFLCPAPSSEFLLQAMRAGVREVLPSPVSASALLETARRLATRQATRHVRPAGKVLSFMSCKGGSGATFIATNLGCLLAEQNSVLLIDLNLQFGDALSFLHDTAPVATIADLAQDIGRLDAVLLARSAVEVVPNFSILAAPEDPAQAGTISAAHVDAIVSLAVTQYDFVLIDLPRSLDAVSIKALDRTDRLYTVLQAGLPYLRNAVKLQTVFRSLGHPPDKLEWIVNRHGEGGQIGLDQVRLLLEASRLSVIGNATVEATRSLNTGRPFAELAGKNPVASSLRELKQSIDPRPAGPRSFFARLFGRT